jgi:general secretion pathway protein J
LIELLVALLILSLLALMSYRGLGAVLDARDRVSSETAKWRDLGAFFARFEQDAQLAEPRAIRSPSGDLPAWMGRPEPSSGSLVEFSRTGSIDGVDTPRRTGYRRNEQGEIELWLWPGLDAAPATQPARHVLLRNVATFQVEYLNNEAAWVDTWPYSRIEAPVPRAVRIRIALTSGEDVSRVFALKL